MGHKITSTTGEARHVRLDPPAGFREANRDHMTEIVNQIVNWLRLAADDDTRARFFALCKDHNTSRRTEVRLYWDAADYVREIAIKYDIAMTTVLHCAMQTAKEAGWFEEW